MERRPLLLLDGMSLAFRAFFALPPDMATKDGVVTNAVYGFMSMLAVLAKDQQPSGIAVAFDLPGGTFRDEMVADYKGGRDATPPSSSRSSGSSSISSDRCRSPLSRRSASRRTTCSRRSRRGHATRGAT